MAELKTRPTDDSVERFIERIADEGRREDCRVLVGLMQQATKAPPRMWGSGIVGFGDLHYKNESGREGDWFQVGFSPRKEALTLYLMGGLMNGADLLKTLGKHKAGKGCLYLKKLEDAHLPTLKKLIQRSVQKA